MKSFALLLFALVATAAPIAASDTVVPRVEAIDAEGVRKLLGQRAVVFGTVERTNEYLDKMTFINFPGQTFTVVCFKRNYDRFAKPPAKLLDQKYIEIIGIISEYKGKIQIVLEGPEQLLKLEEPPVGESVPKAPENAPETIPGEAPEDIPEVVDPEKFFEE